MGTEADELKDRIRRAAMKLWLVVNNQNPLADGKAEVREALAILTGETVGCPGCGLTQAAHGPDCPAAKPAMPLDLGVKTALIEGHWDKTKAEMEKGHREFHREYMGVPVPHEEPE